jgi:hypothetical protein
MSRSGICLSLITRAVVLVASALLSVNGMQIAQAQTQETTIKIDNFFLYGSGELQPGAREKFMGAMEVARRCPSYISFGLHIPQGQWTPNPELSKARFDALRSLAGDQIEFHSSNPEAQHREFTGIEVRWKFWPDWEKPKLDVIWTPPKGTVVKRGANITAKLTVRDDATPAQTGVAHIHVYSVSGGFVAAPAQYPGPMPLQECGRQNPVRTYEATYTVPSNPPPVVQMRAYARDFADNDAWDDADFPVDNERGDEPPRDATAPPSGGGGGQRQRRACEDLIIRGVNVGKWCP